MSSQAGDQFLSLLDPNPAKAEQKYRALRAKLVLYFQHNGCIDAENLADEVVFRAMRRVATGVEAYAGVNAYCFGVAEFVLQEDRRRPRPQELPPELPQQHRPPSALSRSEQSMLVRQYLAELPEADRDLFVSYYLNGREQLAKSVHMTANGLRIRVFRIKQRLQQRLELSQGKISPKSETI